MYFLLEKVNFQPAMLVYWRVSGRYFFSVAHHGVRSGETLMGTLAMRVKPPKLRIFGGVFWVVPYR